MIKKPFIKEYRKESIAKMTRNPSSSMFPYMERMIGGIKLVLADYEEISSSTRY
jgi:hypothetical protein